MWFVRLVRILDWVLGGVAIGSPKHYASRESARGLQPTVAVNGCRYGTRFANSRQMRGATTTERVTRANARNDEDVMKFCIAKWIDDCIVYHIGVLDDHGTAEGESDLIECLDMGFEYWLYRGDRELTPKITPARCSPSIGRREAQREMRDVR